MSDLSSGSQRIILLPTHLLNSMVHCLITRMSCITLCLSRAIHRCNVKPAIHFGGQKPPKPGRAVKMIATVPLFSAESQNEKTVNARCGLEEFSSHKGGVQWGKCKKCPTRPHHQGTFGLTDLYHLTFETVIKSSDSEFFRLLGHWISLLTVFSGLG